MAPLALLSRRGGPIVLRRPHDARPGVAAAAAAGTAFASHSSASRLHDGGEGGDEDAGIGLVERDDDAGSDGDHRRPDLLGDGGGGGFLPRGHTRGRSSDADSQVSQASGASQARVVAQMVQALGLDSHTSAASVITAAAGSDDGDGSEAGSEALGDGDGGDSGRFSSSRRLSEAEADASVTHMSSDSHGDRDVTDVHDAVGGASEMSRPAPTAADG